MTIPEERKKLLSHIAQHIKNSEQILPADFTMERGSSALIKGENQDGLDLATEHVKARWKREQEALKLRLVQTDALVCGDIANVRLLGGMDISFVKGSATDACATLVVLDAKDMSVLYEDYRLVQLTRPYIPGFLAFREVDHLLELVQKLRACAPQLVPHVCFVDGNGVLHPRGMRFLSVSQCILWLMR